MAFIPIPNTAKLEMIYLWDSQVVENVYHFESNIAFDLTDMQELATAALVWWNANLKPLINNSVSLNTIRVTDMRTATGGVIEDTTGLPTAGTATGNAVPNNVTVAIKLITTQRGRSFRGRAYHVGLSTTAVAGNTVTSTTRTALRNAYLALFTLSSAPTWSLGVASRFSNNLPRTEGVITEVTDVSVNAIVDSQRRRLPSRGT